MLERADVTLSPPIAAPTDAFSELAREFVRIADLARETLRRSESRYRRLFESARDGILLLNADTAQIEDVNPYLIEMLGYSHAEFLGKKLWEVGPFADFAQSKEVFAKLRAEGYVRYENLPLRTKAGRYIPVEFVSNSYDYEGVTVIQCNVRDISDRVLLEKSRADLSKMVETSNEAIFSEDLWGIVTSWNPAASSLFGFTAAEAIGQRISRMALPGPEEHFDSLIDEFRNRKSIIDFETKWSRKDGSIVDVSLSLSPIKAENGELAGVSAFAKDIGERKRAAAALRSAEEQFRALVEQSIAGIYIVQDGKFAYVNPYGARILGHDSIDELVGTNPLDSVVEADRSMVAEKMRQLLEGEANNLGFEFSAPRVDGVVIQVGLNAAICSHRGRPALMGLLQDISEKKRNEGRIQRYIDELKTAFMSSVEVATIISEMRDPYTAGHERRVAALAVAIAADLGFDTDRQEGLRVAAYLHDVGKMSIPAEILAKPTKLSAVEMQLVRGHAQASFDVLKGVKFPWPVAQIALEHHERMDGSGYPQGLKGEATLLESRILAVADVVEAMSSHRPYRPGLGIGKALTEIERGRGTAYDPVVADACLRLFREESYEIPNESR